MPMSREELTGDCAWSVDMGAVDTLIARHIDSNPEGLGVQYACLRGSQLAVWLLIANMDPLGDSLEALAEDYEITPEAVLAALYFYWRHRDLIDARISRGRSTYAL